jgi:hypothetical protein
MKTLNNNKWTIVGVIMLVIVLGLLFAWPKMNNADNPLTEQWLAMGIDCLTGGHGPTASHIHPHLQMLINGRQQTISSDIGILRGCMAEMHTHDASGKIHVESVTTGKVFTLGQFFAIWEEKIEKDGYKLEATVDGKINTDASNLILINGQQIILNYISNEE